MTDRRTPFTYADERTTLVDFLDYLRESVIIKAGGLDDEQLRTPGVPSGTSLMGLIKHLTRVEIAWFQLTFAGESTEAIPEDHLTPEDTAADLIACYRRVIAHNNAIVAGCDDLETVSAHRLTAPEPPTLRWVLVHMIEETGRHAGHADILREQIDGSVGR